MDEQGKGAVREPKVSWVSSLICPDYLATEGSRDYQGFQVRPGMSALLAIVAIQDPLALLA